MTTVTVKTPLGTVERELLDWEAKEANLPEGLIHRARAQGFYGRCADTSGVVFVPPGLIDHSLIYIR